MKLRCIESYSDHYKVGEEYEVIEQLENDRFIIPHPNDVTDTVNVPLNGYLWRFEIAKENKGMKEFKVGQKVRIREWDDMAKEFGLLNEDFIDCDGSFLPEMKCLCGDNILIANIEEYGYVKYDHYAIHPCMCELVEDVKEQELNVLEVIEIAKDGDIFKAKITYEDDESFTLKVKYSLGDLYIVESDFDIDGVESEINDSYTMEEISQMKFTKLEKELTLDDFEIGEFFRVADCQGEFVKIVIVDEMYIFCKIDDNMIQIKEEQLKDAKFIKIEENE